MILTHAMQKNALRALGVDQDGTVASVTITPNEIVVVPVRTEDAHAWTEVRHVADRDDPLRTDADALPAYECTDCGHPHKIADETYRPCAHSDCRGAVIGGKCWITVPDG